MQGKTHMAAATAISLGIVTYKTQDFGLLQSGVLIASTIAGSLLPDIDIKNSKVSHKHKFLSFFIRLFIEHRGTHSIIFMALLSIPLFLMTMILPSELRPYGILFGFGILLGYASHIILDMLTPKGSPVLNPVCKYSVSILRIETGGVIEFVIRMALYIAVIYMAWVDVSPIVSAIIERLLF